MKLQVGVKAFIKNRQGKYLFLKRAKILIDEKVPSWTIPGGRINAGEPLLKGLAREIKEETGLKLVGIPKLLYAQDIIRPHLKRHIVRLTFVAKAVGTVVIDQDNEKDHEEYKWLYLSELKNLPKEKLLLPVIKQLISISSKK